MKKIVIILAFVAASMTGLSQALPGGSVKFGTMTWLAPDGGVWTGSSFTGYNQVLSLNMTGVQTVAGDVVFTNPLSSTSFVATGTAISEGMNIIAGSNNSGGMVAISGNETKAAGFPSSENSFVVGYGTTTPGQHLAKFSLDLPTGNAEFSGRVSGDDGVSDNDFVTVGQLQGGGGSGALAAPKTFYVFDGEADNTADSVLLRNIDLQSDGFWKGNTADEGSRIEFEIRGSFANSGQDNYLTIHIGASPFWKKTVPQGTIPAQEFWISGTITKLSAVEIRYEIDFKCGDADGVDFHTIETGIDNGTGDWNLETGPDAELDVITDKTFSGATVISHARFTKFPINGTYITNF